MARVRGGGCRDGEGVGLNGCWWWLRGGKGDESKDLECDEVIQGNLEKLERGESRVGTHREVAGDL